MKKQSLLLLAGGMLALASCQNEAAAPAAAGTSEAQIDSIVNERVEAKRLEMMASNDSLINVLAQWKADSMIAAMKGSKPAAPKPVAKKPAPPSAASSTSNQNTTKPATVGNGKPSMSGSQSGTVGNGKPSMSGDKKEGEVGNGKPSMK